MTSDTRKAILSLLYSQMFLVFIIMFVQPPDVEDDERTEEGDAMMSMMVVSPFHQSFLRLVKLSWKLCMHIFRYSRHKTTWLKSRYFKLHQILLFTQTTHCTIIYPFWQGRVLLWIWGCLGWRWRLNALCFWIGCLSETSWSSQIFKKIWMGYKLDYEDVTSNTRCVQVHY